MKVLKSWGAAGEVVLSRPADSPQDLNVQEPVFIEFDGLPVPFYFESLQEKGNRLIVKFEDVDTLAQAEELVGREVRFASEEEEEEDTLIGLRVRDSRTRRIIGEIVDFSDYGGNIVLTVETEDSGEVLLPLHEELIVNIHGEVITLDIPEGLL
ncbi:MAG: PRC-barrel domain-containing protein [Bacteroidales bacterium]|nr:PRC-barrel domain-containing protein [Bacteroidales bacterium]